MSQVVWGIDHAVEGEGDTVALDRVVGFDEWSLEPLIEQGVETSLTSGGFGKGASGTGVAPVLEVAEHALNDTASLIGIGLALREAIKRISRQRGGKPQAADIESLAALAAAEAPSVRLEPAVWRHMRTLPLTTNGSVGTDMRDIWVSTFVDDPRGVALLVFMSPSTRYLGTLQVAAEWSSEASGRVRSDEELASLLTAWFEPDADQP